MSNGCRKDVHNVPRPFAPQFGTNRVRAQPDRAIRALDGCNGAELSYFIGEVVRMGFCVSFTATSDGGAISVVVFDGARRYKGYCRNPDEFPERFHEILCELRGEE